MIVTIRSTKDRRTDPLAEVWRNALKQIVVTKCTQQPQFAELALAQELRHPVGGLSGSYHIALARLHLQKEEYKEAEAAVQDALQFSYQVLRTLFKIYQFRGSVTISPYYKKISFYNQSFGYDLCGRSG